LLAFIRTRVGSQQVAEDILQDVFLKVLTKLDSVNNPKSLRAWVYQIARNAMIDHIRSAKSFEELPEELAAEDDEKPAAQELMRCFEPMIEALPKGYREAVRLSEIRGIPLREVAQAQGISLSGAKSRVQRGRQKLKKMLLDCCKIEITNRGGVVDCEPKQSSGCCTERSLRDERTGRMS